MINFAKGGAITYKRDHCTDCNTTATTAEIVKESIGNQKLQRHNASRHLPLDNAFHPLHNSDQKATIVCHEVAGVYPLAAGNEIWLHSVPPQKFVTHLYLKPEECPTVYGNADTSLAGLTFDVLSQQYDVNGVAVGVSTVHMAGVVASTATLTGMAISPALGGKYTGANYELFGIKVITNPTNNPLSAIQCGFELTVHALSE